MTCNEYFALLNRRNMMSDKERRADIVNETFAPVFNFLGTPKPDCQGCRETLDNQLICCCQEPDA